MYSTNKPPSRNTHATATMRSALAVTPGAGAARRRYQSIDFDGLDDGCKSTLLYDVRHCAKKRRDSIQASPDRGAVSILYQDDPSEPVFHSRNKSRNLQSSKPGNFSTLNGFRQGKVFIRKKPNCVRTTLTNRSIDYESLK